MDTELKINVVYWVGLLFILFQIKHFFADYIFQTDYHLRKGSLNDWLFPLMSHASVHAWGTVYVSMIALGLTNFKLKEAFEIAILLALVDFVTHVAIDRIKASPNLLGRYKLPSKSFWIALGLDQMAHHIVSVGLVVALTIFILTQGS